MILPMVLALSETTVQTIIRLPELTATEFSAIRLITAVGPKATEDYIQRDMLTMTGGRPVRMTLMPDHVRLSVTVPGDDVSSALSITESVLRRAVLRQEDLNSAGIGTKDYWFATISPIVPMKPKMPREEVLALYRRVFVPAHVTVNFGGLGDIEQGQAEWAQRIASWRVPRARFRRTLPGKEDVFTTNPGGIDTLSFVGKTIPARDPALPTQLFALIALGSGKGSSLHRVWREARGWSYRQESVLWPIREGWQPQLVAAMDPSKSDEARKALMTDIEAWTEADRSRTLGMAEGVLKNAVLFNPLYLSPSGPLGNDLADRTYLAAYWRWKTNSPWDPNRLVELMGMIKLDELKLVAREIVEGSTVRILPER